MKNKLYCKHCGHKQRTNQVEVLEEITKSDNPSDIIEIRFICLSCGLRTKNKLYR